MMAMAFSDGFPTGFRDRFGNPFDRSPKGVVRDLRVVSERGRG
jgi:hypothetical protein